MQTLTNKTALITGASKGIGLGIAEAMVKNGMNVIITGRNQDSLNQACNSLDGISAGKCLAEVADVRSITDMQRVAQSGIAKFNAIDIVIANAGVGHFASIEDLTSEQWSDMIDINLTGVFNTIKPCIESLKQTKGYFITVASLAGTNFFAKGSAYNASKFGLVGFTQAVMMDLRKYGIKTTTLMPGSVATYFNNNTPSEKDAWKIQPQDLGQMVIDLLKLDPRTLPSKVEIRPSFPPAK